MSNALWIGERVCNGPILAYGPLDLHYELPLNCCNDNQVLIEFAVNAMDAPMSEWFQSIPLSLDAIAYAAKFQQEAMASQIRYHRLRHQQLRQLVERLKQEIAELKRNQPEQRHQHVGMSRTQDNEVSDHLNVNGKREMLYTHQFDQSYRKTRTDSSPRSITTPIGPDRLTLLPGQQLPELSTHKQQEQRKYSHSPVYMRDGQSRGYQNGMSVGQSSNRVPERPESRPTSSLPLQQYAFSPQESGRFNASSSNQGNASLQIFQRANQRHQNPRSNQVGQPSNAPLPHPASSSRFKPSLALYAPPPPLNAPKASANRQPMGPPPTPQHVRDKLVKQGHDNTDHHGRNIWQTPANSDGAPNTGGSASRRFFAERSDNANAGGVAQTRGISRASATPVRNTPGHRTPFVSNLGQRSGFG
ncbi:hypothetical protein D9613_002707 [Agrocybe pediades]|uniref:Uncharacterized protein n=1 Tax=Agrocybe pediades TaxID=84607 RepID=A0A8H4QPJ1_9AGAR|nr:hypothetical protein D9613_002707 [Agrocybe pediades]